MSRTLPTDIAYGEHIATEVAFKDKVDTWKGPYLRALATQVLGSSVGQQANSSLGSVVGAMSKDEHVKALPPSVYFGSFEAGLRGELDPERSGARFRARPPGLRSPRGASTNMPYAEPEKTASTETPPWV